MGPLYGSNLVYYLLTLKNAFVHMHLKNKIVESVRRSIFNHLIEAFGVEWWSWCFVTSLMTPLTVTVPLAFLNYAFLSLSLSVVSRKWGCSTTVTGSSPLLFALTFTVHIWHNSDRYNCRLCIICSNILIQTYLQYQLTSL